jgi:hypothetical protein
VLDWSIKCPEAVELLNIVLKQDHLAHCLEEYLAKTQSEQLGGSRFNLNLANLLRTK